jgi:hypothetical protein
MSGWDASCEYCRVYNEFGVWVRCAPCGMTYEEHEDMKKEREKADAQAHALVMEARKRELLPKAIIREAYKNATQESRVFLDEQRRRERRQ